jgi:hypothetical protein
LDRLDRLDRLDGLDGLDRFEQAGDFSPLFFEFVFLVIGYYLRFVICFFRFIGSYLS